MYLSHSLSVKEIGIQWEAFKDIAAGVGRWVKKWEFGVRDFLGYLMFTSSYSASREAGYPEG